MVSPNHTNSVQSKQMAPMFGSSASLHQQTTLKEQPAHQNRIPCSFIIGRGAKATTTASHSSSTCFYSLTKHNEIPIEFTTRNPSNTQQINNPQHYETHIRATNLGHQRYPFKSFKVLNLDALSTTSNNTLQVASPRATTPRTTQPNELRTLPPNHDTNHQFEPHNNSMYAPQNSNCFDPSSFGFD